MIITIAGESGSGKTSIGKELAKRLNYKFFSMGDIRGKIAQERGLTIDELNQLGEKERWTDTIIEDYQRELGKKEDNLILEGRLSWYCIPKSKKIFLYVDKKIGAERIFLNQRKDEKKANNIEEMIKIIGLRKKSDVRRYKKIYQINPYEKKHYDLVIDTTTKTLKEVCFIILKEIK